MKYIIFTCDGYGLPVAQHLQQEGEEVIVGQVINKRTTLTKFESKKGNEEYPLDQKRRINLFKNMVEKIPADILSADHFEKNAHKNADDGEIPDLISKLSGLGIKNVKFDPKIARGFDYYTGIIFEVFDTSPENNRSLFGGGRYDNLLEIFGVEPIPTVGFGMGDVTIRDFLETHNLPTCEK